MEKKFDPNVPDTSNGDFFCRLCFASANSDNMWASHIAGKRHIKNMMKYPEGIPSRQYDEDSFEKPPRQYDEDYEDSFEKPPKYRRYESDEEWDDYRPKEHKVGYNPRKDYIPEIKPQVIDYGHKKSLPSSSKVLDDVSMIKEHESSIEKIFSDDRFDRLKKPFEEEYFKRQANGTLQNKWNSNNLKESRKDIGLLFDRLKKPFEEESSKRQTDGTLHNKWNSNNSKESRRDLDLLFDILKKPFEKESSKRQADGTLQNKWNSSSLKESRKETVDDDNFEKELDELLYNSSGNSGLKNKDVFCKDAFKKQIDDILQGKSSNRESEDSDLEIINIVDCSKDISHKSSNRTKSLNQSITTKKRDDEDKPKLHRDLEKKKRKKEDDEDFVDIFHKMNDQRLFRMSAADEAESPSVEKSSKTENTKLENIDPDKLTPDLLDNLLSSYLKPKASSSEGKDSSESCKRSSTVNDVKEEDPDIIAEKLESLPSKTFFQIIITRLKKLDLKDSDELSMLLDVISEAQAVVCKKLPPHLQAVIKSKMSQNHSKTAPVPVQYPQLPQSNSLPTALPLVSQPVSQAVSQTVSQPVLKCGSQSLSQGEIKTVSQSSTQVASHPVQAAVTYVQPQTKSSLLNTSDSLQSMIAWQSYLESKDTTSTKPTLSASNSVQAMVAYQNYLSSLQAKAAAGANKSSKTTSANLTSVIPPSNSKTTISTRPYCTSVTPTFSQTIPVISSRKPTLNTSNSVETKKASQNFLSSEQIAASKTVSQTPSSSSKNFSLPRALRSSQDQTSDQKGKCVSQVNVQTTSNRPELPSNPALVPNQTALQAYYQQMYAMCLNRMPSVNTDSLTSASTASLWQNSTVSQPNITYTRSSQSGGAK